MTRINHPADKFVRCSRQAHRWPLHSCAWAAVRNAFAEDGLIPVTVQPGGQSWAQGRVKPYREWS